MSARSGVAGMGAPALFRVGGRPQAPCHCGWQPLGLWPTSRNGPLSGRPRVRPRRGPEVRPRRESCRAAASTRPEAATPSSRTPGAVSIRKRRSRAAAITSWAPSVGSGSVTDRVMVLKSPKRSFSVMVRAWTLEALSRRATASASRVASASSSAPVCRSRGKVASWLIERGRRFTTTGRSSMPLASRCRWRPAAAPSAATAAGSGSEARSPTVSIPRRTRRREVAGPTPRAR